MKYATLLLCLGSLITFSSCKKKCGTCTTNTTSTISGGSPQTSTSSFNACGDEFEQYDGKTTNATTGTPPYSVTVSTVTKCVED